MKWKGLFFIRLNERQVYLNPKVVALI